MTSPNTKFILDTVATLMDGEALPRPDSAAFDQLRQAIAGFLKDGTADDRAALGIRCLGLLIDRGRASIAAGEALRDLGGQG